MKPSFWGETFFQNALKIFLLALWSCSRYVEGVSIALEKELWTYAYFKIYSKKADPLSPLTLARPEFRKSPKIELAKEKFFFHIHWTFWITDTDTMDAFKLHIFLKLVILVMIRSFAARITPNLDPIITNITFKLNSYGYLEMITSKIKRIYLNIGLLHSFDGYGAAVHFDPECVLIAFEPQPEKYQHLLKFDHGKNWNRILLLPYAIANVTEPT